MEFAAVSDIGLVREKNEDSFLVNESKKLFIICDGMGGHNGGEVASSMAVQEIGNIFSNGVYITPINILNEAINVANRNIYLKAQSDPSLFEMGTTITAAVIDAGILLVAHVGDSSLFLIRDHNIRKITRDHTLAEQMVGDGILKIEEANNSPYRHVLTRALGVEERVAIDFYQEQLLHGDVVLLCSDGLSDMIAPAEMLEILNNNSELESACRVMLTAALDNGGHDNITIIIVRV